MTPTINKLPHTKIILAGLLTTGSSVRDTMGAVFTFNYPQGDGQRQEAVLRYLRQLGVPTADDEGNGGLLFDDIKDLLKKAFPGGMVFPKSVSRDDTFPINMDYDQDNCDYEALIAGGVSLDQNETPDE